MHISRKYAKNVNITAMKVEKNVFLAVYAGKESVF